MCENVTSCRKVNGLMVGESALPVPLQRPSRKLSGAMAGCSAGNSTLVTPSSPVLSGPVLSGPVFSPDVPSSAMRASPDHLDGRVAGCDGDHGIGQDNDRRAEHPVHGWSLGAGSDLCLAARRGLEF